eukprot:651866-Rhodomonas_salina.2
MTEKVLTTTGKVVRGGNADRWSSVRMTRSKAPGVSMPFSLSRPSDAVMMSKSSFERWILGWIWSWRSPHMRSLYESMLDWSTSNIWNMVWMRLERSCEVLKCASAASTGSNGLP